MNGTDLSVCINSNQRRLKAFLFDFRLSYGSEITDNFVKTFILKNRSQKKKKAIRGRGERTHLGSIVSLLTLVRRVQNL